VDGGMRANAMGRNRSKRISSKPLVTALICNYNYGRFLADALESALAQTWQPMEVLVVDDGSTDESRSVLEKYRSRVKVILKENGGQASAFNAGIAEANGEIICFLDSDDFWYPERVERTVAKYREGPFGLVCGELQMVNEKGVKIKNLTNSEFMRTHMESGDLLEYRESRGCQWVFSPTSGMSIPAWLAHEVFPLPEEEWRISADVPVALSAICHAPVGVITRPLGAYRYHGLNEFASIGNDRTEMALYKMTSRVNQYLFLNGYLESIGRRKLDKGPREFYKDFRSLCFITKRRPWIDLANLWKGNIKYHFGGSRKVKSRWFNAALYLMFDTLVSVLFFLHLPTPYRAHRKRFKEVKPRLNTRTREYLENC
jgi:glycosyltransferase involved in cell wall biosynthesis